MVMWESLQPARQASQTRWRRGLVNLGLMALNVAIQRVSILDSVTVETRRRVLRAGMNSHELGAQWDVDTIADCRRYLSRQNA